MRDFVITVFAVSVSTALLTALVPGDKLKGPIRLLSSLIITVALFSFFSSLFIGAEIFTPYAAEAPESSVYEEVAYAAELLLEEDILNRTAAAAGIPANRVECFVTSENESIEVERVMIYISAEADADKLKEELEAYYELSGKITVIGE